MPRPPKGARLGSGPAHERLLLRGLAAELFMQERIRTTQTRAKRLRPVAEKLITLGKTGSVHARRQALSMIEDRNVIHKLFSDIGPRFNERSGGYTRVLKLGPRQGDAAPMAIIELIEAGVVEESSEETGKRRRRGLRRKKPAPEAAAPEQTNEAEDEAPAQAESEPAAAEPETAELTAEGETTVVAEAEGETTVVAEAEGETTVVADETPSDAGETKE